VVGHNASFLSSDKSKSVVEHNLDKLEKYIENPSLDNILILVCDSLDKRKKITSNICKKMNVIETTSDIHTLIRKRLEEYKMDSNSEKLLLEYCGNDFERVLNEIDKLKLYKIESKKITKDDIEEIVMKSMDDNIFHLVDSILTGNKKYAFLLYQDFILHGEQVVNIIRILANKIRLIYQVKVLLNNGNSDQNISKLLKVHEYPVKLAREASYRYNEQVLLEKLETLANLDLLIKSGETNGQVEFETLIATI
jgi:DNA polymerase-3 subunit delta